MPIVNVQKKFPKQTVAVIIIFAFVIVLLLGFLIPEFGAALLGFGSWLLFDIVIGGFVWLATPQVAVALGLTALVIFVVLYRRNYAKKKVYVPTGTGTTLPASDQLASPLFDDTEVSST